jgi:hypothetical protein
VETRVFRRKRVVEEGGWSTRSIRRSRSVYKVRRARGETLSEGESMVVGGCSGDKAVRGEASTSSSSSRGVDSGSGHASPVGG